MADGAEAPTQDASYGDDSSQTSVVEAEQPKCWGRCVPSASPQAEEKAHLLIEHEILIGRKPECQIQRKENTVSGVHCRIFRDSDNTVWLEDLSTNGTFVGNKKVGKGNKHLLSTGVEIFLIPNNNKSKYPPISYHFFVQEEEETVGNYTIGQQLGSGAFAVVKQGVHKITNAKVAIKVIDKKKFALQNSSSRNALLDEVEILKRLEHPHIIKVFDVIETDPALYIVLELVTGGDLFDEIIRSTKFSEERSRNVMRQMVEALMYLHSQNIVHRDLKPENLLLTVPSKDGVDDIKIADFGLARLISSQSFQMRTLCGTPQYLAPEVITDAQTKGYGKAVDIWSVGVILYVMLSGQAPFSESEHMSVLDQVKSGRVPFPPAVWDLITPAARDLVRKMLLVDPAKRISLKDILAHPWMTAGGRMPAPAPAEKKAASPPASAAAARKRKDNGEQKNGNGHAAPAAAPAGTKRARVAAKPDGKAQAPEEDEDEKEADDSVSELPVTKARPAAGAPRKKPSYLDEDSVASVDDISTKDEAMPQAPSVAVPR